MLTFQMLGCVALAGDDGAEVDALLRQTKHLALLAYLALPRPGTWHRRDTLLALFWPELDEARARTALRSALHLLRRHLGPHTVRNRGTGEVGLAPEALATDVGRLRDAAAAGRHADALACYRGEFLPALHVDAADDFQRWLEAERVGLRALARRSASALAREREQGGDLAAAVDAARRAAELDPDDEGVARALIALLDRTGDRAQAFAVYERHRTHLAAEFGARPSAETLALVEAVRTRRTVGAAPTGDTLDEGPIADAPALPRAPAPTSTPTSTPPPLADPAPLVSVPVQPADRAPATPAAAALARARSGRRRYAPWGAAAGVAVVLATLLTPRARSHASSDAGRAAVAVPHVLVLPPENATHDSAQAYLATGVSDDVARQLARLGTLAVSSSVYAPWPAATPPDVRALGRRFGSTILLRLTLARAGGAASDSLEVRPVLFDQSARADYSLAPARFAPRDVRDVASAVTAQIVGAVFRVPEPLTPHPPAHTVDPESYRLTLGGWHHFFTGWDPPGTRARFEDAIRRDPLNARAWAGVATSWAAQLVTDEVPADEAYENASAAAMRALALDSLEGSAWADLALVRMTRARSFAAGAPFLHRATTADPSNPEAHLVASNIYRVLHRWGDARAEVQRARALDPLNPFYLGAAVRVELCADHPAAALALANEGLRADSRQWGFWMYRVRALARLGRYEEAIATWRDAMPARLPPPVGAALNEARGAADYWTAWRAQGRWNLARLRAAGAYGWVSPRLVAFATVQAGDTAGGWRALDAQVPAREWMLYRLPCQEEFDEERGTPRYAALLARIGPMPER